MKSLYPFLLLLCSCAVVVHPTGGEQDTEPQKVVEVYPDSNATNFNDRHVLIRFDEYFEIKDQNAILISPPLEEKPDFEIIKKTLRIRFNSRLRDSTTYTIQLTEALHDLNEKNVLPNYELSFSTGPDIDTHYMAGKIIDNYTGQNQKGFTIALFHPDLENYPDSQIFPLYFSKSLENGSFSIPAIKYKPYTVYAFEDINHNLKIDPGEKVAFLDSAVFPNDSILLKSGTYKIMPNLTSGIVNPIDNQSFKVSLIRPEKGKIEIKSRTPVFDKTQKLYIFFTHPDTLTVIDLIKQKSDSTAEYLLSLDGTTSDTFQVNYPKSSPHYHIHVLNPNDLLPDNPVSFISNYPIQHLVTGRFSLYENDTVPVKINKFNSDEFSFQLMFHGKQNSFYSLVLSDSAIGFSNNDYYPRDTLRFSLKNPEQYGHAIIHFQNPDNDSVRVELLEQIDKEPIFTIITRTDSVNFRNIPAGQYTVRVVTLETNNSPRFLIPFRKQLSPVVVARQPLIIRSGWTIGDFKVSVN